MGRNFPLESSGSIQLGEGKNEGKKKKEEKRSEKLHLLSRIYEDRAFCFRRSNRQSSSKRRELPVGTRIRGFCQTPRGRGFFSYFRYFWSKSHLMTWSVLGP